MLILDLFLQYRISQCAESTWQDVGGCRIAQDLQSHVNTISMKCLKNCNSKTRLRNDITTVILSNFNLPLEGPMIAVFLLTYHLKNQC